MRALIFSNDERYQEIIRFFHEKGHWIDEADEKGIQIDVSVYDIIIFPIPGISNGFFAGSTLLPPEFLNDSKEDVIIFSGIRTPCLSQMLAESNRECIYFMEDEQVAMENAIPTVEGIIADLVLNTKITIHDADIMVIGYGKVGKPLVLALTKLGAHVFVGVNKEKDIEELELLGILGVDTKQQSMGDYVRTVDMIINTVPALVLEESHIVNLNKEVYVLDVSSYPYGIDQEALKFNEISYKIYPKIPSRVAPKTSGKILAKKIETVMEQEL